MADIKVGCLTIGVLENNTYFLHREGEYDCILIDPAKDGDTIVTRLREKGLEVKAIFLTHGHFDHLLGVAGVKKVSDAPLYGGKDDAELFINPELNHSNKFNNKVSIKLDKELSEGDEITVGSMKCKVLATPGHTAGSICFYFEEEGLLFSGDTLFFETTGRTDFETGSDGDLRKSIDRLLKLPPETVVYPGHNDFTTIGHEIDYNPLSRH